MAKLDLENHDLIIALDNMSEDEVKEVVENISIECEEYMNNIRFKVNDLLAEI
jgi:hypothetical protein